jgi:hypothetical protein
MLESVTIERPDAQSVERQVVHLERSAELCIIDSREMLELANDELGAIKTFLRNIEAEQKKILAPLAEAEERVRALFRSPIQRAKAAETALKGRMAAYLDQEERKRIAAEREAEQKRREEYERAVREAAAREDAVRKEAEAKITAAREAEAAGNMVEANALFAQAESAVLEAQVQTEELATMPAVPVAAPIKITGLSSRRPWKGRVVNLHKLVTFIAAHPAWLHLVEIPRAKLDAQAKVSEGRLGDVLPGTEGYQETQLARRT